MVGNAEVQFKCIISFNFHGSPTRSVLLERLQDQPVVMKLVRGNAEIEIPGV